MDITTYQKTIDGWIQTHGVRYFEVKTNMLLLMEEIGELSRIIARTHGEQSFKPGKEVEAHAAIEEEIADIYFVLTCIANQLNIDLKSAIEKNLTKKTQRDHDRHKNNPKLL